MKSIMTKHEKEEYKLTEATLIKSKGKKNSRCLYEG